MSFVFPHQQRTVPVPAGQSIIVGNLKGSFIQVLNGKLGQPRAPVHRVLQNTAGEVIGPFTVDVELVIVNGSETNEYVVGVSPVLTSVEGGGSVVSIAGTRAVGSTLTAALATGWTVTGYQWTRDGANISGATSSTYTLVTADGNTAIAVKVSGLVYGASGGTVTVPPLTAGIIVTNRAKVPSITGSISDLLGFRRQHFGHTAGATTNFKFTDLYWNITGVGAIGLPAATPAISIKKFIEYPYGVFTPVLYGGVATVTLDNANRQKTSDSVSGVTVPAGAEWWEHTISVTGSTVVASVIELPAQSGVIGSADVRYTAAAGGVPQSTGGVATNFLGSALITGDVAANGAKAVFAIGDSLLWGQADITSVGSRGSSAWFPRALDRLGVSYAIMGRPGGTAQAIAGLITAADTTLMPFFNLAKAACTHFAQMNGVNDLTLGQSQAQILASHQTIYGAFTGGGRVIMQTTLTPRSTSTDAYATVVNQTAKVDGNYGEWANVNIGIRAVSGVTIIEAANTATPSVGQGVWIAPPTISEAATLDGTHMVSTMCNYMAQNVPLAI